MKNGDIICPEHGTRLGDDDLIDAICEEFSMTRETFDRLPEAEQRAYQIGWVTMMPILNN